MKQKLIKLSDIHYIVVDDSEIREGDYFYSENERGCVRALVPVSSHTGNFKITHSTVPLEYDEDGGFYPPSVISISLSDIEFSDQQFTRKQVKEAISFGFNIRGCDQDLIAFTSKSGYGVTKSKINLEKIINDFIDGLLLREWDIEIDNNKIKIK